MIHTEVIVVGQGIGGTMIALALEDKGIDFRIIDNDHFAASSLVAAGTINPVTGRNYVKSWMFDELFATLDKRYLNENDKISTNTATNSIYRNLPIVRSLHTIQDENNWLARCQDPSYSPYIDSTPDTGNLNEWISPPHAYGIVHKAMQVNLRALCTIKSKLWKASGKLISDNFDHSALIVAPNEVSYKDIKASKIVFAEGHNVLKNSYFNDLAFDPVKGEALIISLKDGFEISVRDQIFITPIGNNQYWCGAGYEWKYDDHLPTAKGRAQIEDTLNKILLQPYEIVDHWAGIRPASKSRRPIVGQHAEHKALYIFNGLGTKGSSLAPYFAEQLVDIMINF